MQVEATGHAQNVFGLEGHARHPHIYNCSDRTEKTFRHELHAYEACFYTDDEHVIVVKNRGGDGGAYQERARGYRLLSTSRRGQPQRKGQTG